MKLNLQLTALALSLSIGAFAQTGKIAYKNTAIKNQTTKQAIIERGCGTANPGEQWDAWFNKQVEEFKAANLNGKNQMVNYTIPVIVHVIHSGQAVGSGFNISQAQVIDQINILNADFAGIGLNSGSVPSIFAPLKANCQLSFCLATKNPTGGVLGEPGIERINSSTMGWTTSNYSTAYVDATIKPASIWDPTRYFNMWVLDLGSGVLGFATFPTGTSLSGITGNGTATTDGVAMVNTAFGSIGSATGAPYNKGRTTTHEVGHWLGLRHIWGDGTCATDFCNDTPTSQQSNFGCPTHPYKVGTCSGNTTGEMFQNFMDYTDDACMYMFTIDQRTRMQTAMNMGTYRSQLSTSANTLCTVSAAAPTASFVMPATVCTTVAVNLYNYTTNNPVSTFTWSANPSAGVIFNPSNTSISPTVTFPSAGNYSITLVATNTVGTNSSTKTISITSCSGGTTAVACNDTLTNFNNTDTLNRYAINSGTVQGYVGGNNTYGDLEKGEYYSSTGLVGTSKVVGGIVLFYRHASANIGTKGAGNVVFKLYNGNNTTGPSGVAINSFTVPISTILATPSQSNVNYCGNPSLAFSTSIIKPYSFTFPTATNITGDFILAVKLPTATGDTAAIFVSSENGRTVSTAWELQPPSSWVPFNDGTTVSWQLNASLAILPKIQCISVGAIENSILDKGITMYPNPTNGIINVIATLPNSQDIDITINNVMGQLVTKSNHTSITNDVITLDMSKYSNGVYFVTFNNGEEKIVKRIILNK